MKKKKKKKTKKNKKKKKRGLEIRFGIQGRDSPFNTYTIPNCEGEARLDASRRFRPARNGLAVKRLDDSDLR